MQTSQQFVSPLFLSLFWWFSFYSDFLKLSLIFKSLTK
jgi:hypothetical protein